MLLDSGALLIRRLLVCFEASLSLLFFLCFLFVETFQEGSFAFELSAMAVLLVKFLELQSDLLLRFRSCLLSTSSDVIKAELSLCK